MKFSYIPLLSGTVLYVCINDLQYNITGNAYKVALGHLILIYLKRMFTVHESLRKTFQCIEVRYLFIVVAIYHYPLPPSLPPPPPPCDTPPPTPSFLILVLLLDS
jgi:hypothetical protein